MNEKLSLLPRLLCLCGNTPSSLASQMSPGSTLGFIIRLGKKVFWQSLQTAASH